MRAVGGVVLAVLIGLGVWMLLGPKPQPPDQVHAKDDADQGATGPLLKGQAPLEADEAPSAAARTTADDAPKEQVTHLDVWVFDMESGNAIPSARVSVESERVRSAFRETGTEGRTRFEAIENGSLYLVVLAEGYRAVRKRLFISQSRGVRVSLYRGLPFDGRVVDAATQRPQAGASVYVREWGKPLLVATTDRDGRFRIPGIQPNEETTIRVSQPGYTRTERTAAADRTKVRPMPFVVEMARGVSMVGVVSGADGEPVGGAFVRVRVHPERTTVHPESVEDFLTGLPDIDHGLSFGRSPDFEVRTKADGSYRLDGLATNTPYVAWAESKGHAPSALSRRHTKPAVLAWRADFELPRPATLTIRLVLPANHEHAGRSRVGVLCSDGKYRVTHPDKDGLSRFSDLPTGEGYAFAQFEGLMPVAEAVHIASGATHNVALQLEHGAVVEGILVDTEGNPVAGVDVSAAPASRNKDPNPWSVHLVGDREVQSDKQGRFRIAGLGAGATLVVASDLFGPMPRSTKNPTRVTAPASDVRLVLETPPHVRVRLKKPNGAPLPYTHNGMAMMWHGTSSGGGSLTVYEGGVLHEPIEYTGRHCWVIDPNDYAWLRWEFQARDGVVDLGVVTLSKGVVVSGMVVDATGAAIPHASVTCMECSERQTSTSPDGRFSMERFPRVAFHLYVSATGYVGEVVAVAPGQAGRVHVELRRAATVRVRASRVLGDEEASVWLRPFDAVKRSFDWVGFGGLKRTRVGYEGAQELWFEAGACELDVPPGRYVAVWEDAAGKEHRLGDWTFERGASRTVQVVVPEK